MTRESADTLDPLARRAADLKHNVSYEAILAEQGVERDPDTGELVRWVESPTIRDTSGQPMEIKRFVAMTRQEAQEKSRMTSQPWDWYCTGLKCPQCAEPLVGWVRGSFGGLKFEREHDHIGRDRRVTVRRRRGADVAPASEPAE